MKKICEFTFKETFYHITSLWEHFSFIFLQRKLAFDSLTRVDLSCHIQFHSHLDCEAKLGSKKYDVLNRLKRIIHSDWQLYKVTVRPPMELWAHLWVGAPINRCPLWDPAKKSSFTLEGKYLLRKHVTD